MEENMEMSFTVSKHAKERYAERIMNKEDLWDINYFINQNEEMEKVSEVELKKYLSIFANLVFPWQGESNNVPENY